MASKFSERRIRLFTKIADPFDSAAVDKEELGEESLVRRKEP
jgi:hypothetical protein